MILTCWYISEALVATVLTLHLGITSHALWVVILTGDLGSSLYHFLISQSLLWLYTETFQSANIYL